MGYAPVFGAVCHYEFNGDLLDFINIIHEAQLQWVEFKYDRDIIKRGEAQNYQLIRDRLQETGVNISIHAPFEGLNIADLEAAARKQAVEEVKRSIDYTVAVGGNQVTLHGGHMDSREFTPERWRASEQANVESLSELADHADSVGVALCLENGNAFERDKLKHAIYHGEMKAINSQLNNRLSYTVDFGHALYFSSNPMHLLHDLGIELVKMSHLHDNNGTFDSHSELKTGVLDLDKLLAQMFAEQWDFPVCLEIKTVEGIQHSARLLQEKYRSLSEKLGSE